SAGSETCGKARKLSQSCSSTRYVAASSARSLQAVQPSTRPESTRPPIRTARNALDFGPRLFENHRLASDAHRTTPRFDTEERHLYCKMFGALLLVMTVTSCGAKHAPASATVVATSPSAVPTSNGAAPPTTTPSAGPSEPPAADAIVVSKRTDGSSTSPRGFC